jgi:hypothetical protein
VRALASVAREYLEVGSDALVVRAALSVTTSLVQCLPWGKAPVRGDEGKR